MGGWSSEREISIKSGTAVVSTLQKMGYDAVAIDLKDAAASRKTIEEAKIQIVFIALHGPFGESGQVQQLLEEIGIPYTGSGVLASQTAMDKVTCRGVLTRAGVQMPEGVILKLEAGNWTSQIPFPPPWIIKPSQEGSSFGVSIVDQEEDLIPALTAATHYSSCVILEKYISGIEITVGILQDRPLPVIEIVPKNRFYDYDSKYGGGTQYLIPPRLPQGQITEAQEIALKVHRLLGCRNFSRVDMIAENGVRVDVLEINTVPGLTDKSLLPKAAQAAGISFEELCVKILESALERPH